MVVVHFAELGLLLCFEVRFTPSIKSLCDRPGRDLQLYLESPGKSEGLLSVFEELFSVFVSQAETFVCAPDRKLA